MDSPETGLIKKISTHHQWDPRYRVVFTIIAIFAVAIFPPMKIWGSAYFFTLSLIVLTRQSIRKTLKRLFLPLIPALIIFALTPYITAVSGFSQRPPGFELLFGFVITLKTFTILILVLAVMDSVSFSQFLKTLQIFKVSHRILFLLMIAYRYFFTFFNTVKKLIEARTLRLFKQSQLTHLISTLRILILKSMDHAESTYIAMRLRGGESHLPLLASFQTNSRDQVILLCSLIILLIPYLGIFLLK